MRTPLLNFSEMGSIQKLFVKDESVNETGTFKDRLAAAAMRYYPPGTNFAAITYGNTGISFAWAVRRAAEAGLKYNFIAFVPHDLEQWSLGPSSRGTFVNGKKIIEFIASSAKIVPLDLDDDSPLFDDAGLLQIARDSGFSIDNLVNVTEGLPEPAYVAIIEEAVEQMGFLPDFCLVPFGAGILCNEIKDFFRMKGAGKVVPLSVTDRNSSARMLYGPVWVDTATLRRDGVALSRHLSPDRTGQIREPYIVHAVSEEQVLLGVNRARDASLSSEPSGSVGLGVLDTLSEWIPEFNPEKHSVLVINTGNAIDRFLALQR